MVTEKEGKERKEKGREGDREEGRREGRRKKINLKGNGFRGVGSSQHHTAEQSLALSIADA